MKLFRLISLLLMLCPVAFADVQSVRLWHAPDHSRLVFDLSSRPEHKIFMLKSPPRLVIDIEDCKMADELIRDLDVKYGAIKNVRAGVWNKKDLRIVLDLRQDVTPKSFPLKPNDQYGDRLVVDLYDTNPDQPAVEPVTAAASVDAEKLAQEKRDIIIAIDAGHGGDDPGAIGHRGVREKNVVLSIARELEKLFNAEPGFKPYLVRKGDYYIELRERTRIARKASADLFVSIHADAFSSPKAYGSSVFALSQRGATSETARWLADKENASDLVGGAGGLTLGDKEDVLAGVLLDLSMTASLGASLSVGQEVLNNLNKVSKLHKRRVEQAGFMVLKSPDIPSILVETGFISNPGEATKLATSTYQQQIARSVFTGIKNHFSRVPPPGTYLAALRNQGRLVSSGLREYTIGPGDTLSSIADQHRVSTTTLKQLNGLKNDRIHVGQTLKIPAP